METFESTVASNLAVFEQNIAHFNWIVEVKQPPAEDSDEAAALLCKWRVQFVGIKFVTSTDEKVSLDSTRRLILNQLKFEDYTYVAFLSGLVDLSGFAWVEFFKVANHSIITGAIVRDRGDKLRRNYKWHDANCFQILSSAILQYRLWKYGAMEVPWLSHDFALSNSQFTEWLMENTTDESCPSLFKVNLDSIWCGAAKTWMKQALLKLSACTVFTVPVQREEVCWQGGMFTGTEQVTTDGTSCLGDTVKRWESESYKQHRALLTSSRHEQLETFAAMKKVS